MSTRNSCLYECDVVHHRFAPRPHRFRYRIFMLGLDLDEIGSLPRMTLFSVNRSNFYSVRERDYLPLGEPLHNADRTQVAPRPASLKERVVAFVRQNGVREPVSRVMLVTMPKIAGYGFNPVSFYFCSDAEGRPVAAIAEVTNTFREMKPFLVPLAAADAPGASVFRARMPKHFYVSPFTDVDVAFDFRFADISQRLSVSIDDYTDGERTLASTLTGRRLPLSGARLAWFTLKYPLLTLRVISLIHLHALVLWLKRVPWFPKAARAKDQRDLFRPHASIAPTRPLQSP